jgi:hypothetical protein
MVTDQFNNYAGFYAANTAFNDRVLFRRTLIMDDTACTTHFKLPLFAVIGIDENGRNQLIGFAFLIGQTAEEFGNYLKWLQQIMSVPDPLIPAFPRAIIVDRHEGQFKAIRETFPLSHVVFCAKHLGANIRDTFRKGPLHALFWRLIKSQITSDDWRNFLHREIQRRRTATQERLLNWLLDHLGNYDPATVFKYTTEQVTSRVEGFFGTLKIRIHHRQVRLDELAKAIVDLALEAVKKRFTPRVRSFCDFTILRFPDQLRIGVKASKILCEEIGKLSRPLSEIDRPRSSIPDHQCCPIALRWKIPCIHFLILHADRDPRLSSSDFPCNVLLPSTNQPILAEHTRSRSAADRPTREPRWSNRGVNAYLTSLRHGALEGDPTAREIIMRAHDEYSRHTEDMAIEPGIRDPPPVARPGRPHGHPSRNSRLNPTPHRRALPVPDLRCRYCGSMEHTGEQCPRE